MSPYHNPAMKRLYEAILSLQNEDECARFFEDLCTIRELMDMAQRLEAAALLDQKMSYQAIAQQVKISTATIGRVSKCLNYGAGGYRLALNRRKEKEEQS